MTIRLIIIFIISVFSSLTSCKCQKTSVIKGKFYIDKLDFYALYEKTDSILVKLEEFGKNVDLDTISPKDIELVELIKHAVNKKVLRLPYIKVRTDDYESIMLYMPEDKFEIFDSLKFSEISTGKVKVNVIAKARDISYKDIKAFKLIRFKDIKKSTATNNK